MNKYKGNVVLYITVDTAEYPIPADLNLRENLIDDIEEALATLPIKVEMIAVKNLKKVKENDPETEQYDFD